MMAGLFASAPQASQGGDGGGWFPTPDWPGTDIGPQMRMNLQNSTNLPRTSPRRGSDTGVSLPEPNPAFRPQKGEKKAKKGRSPSISPDELEQMVNPADVEAQYYTDVWGRPVESIMGRRVR